MSKQPCDFTQIAALPVTALGLVQAATTSDMLTALDRSEGEKLTVFQGYQDIGRCLLQTGTLCSALSRTIS